MKKYLPIILVLVSFNVFPEGIENSKTITMNQDEIFNYENQSSVKKDFITKEEMVEYLKVHRKRTYFYYQKLDTNLQRKAFVEHIDYPERDITNIIIKLYASRMKGSLG